MDPSLSPSQQSVLLIAELLRQQEDAPKNPELAAKQARLLKILSGGTNSAPPDA